MQKEGIFVFTNKRYITSGVAEKIPLSTQILLWKLIDDLPVDKDHLQIFKLYIENGMQKVIHIQEEPAYEKEYVFSTETPVMCKIYAIDDKTHSTMLLSEEY